MAQKTRAGALLALCGLILLAQACSNVEKPDLAADIARENLIPRDWSPLGLRVGMAPMRAATLDTSRNVADTKRWVLPPEETELNAPIEGLNAQLIAVMREYRMFDHVALIEGVTSVTTTEDLQRLALAQGFDVVMVPNVTAREVSYVDSNGAYGWNMFVWWMVSPIISWYIADEDFECNMNVEMRLYPVTGGQAILTSNLRPAEAVRRSLDDFDHGFNVFSMFNTPGYMGEDNWRKVGSLLLPISENESKKALLRFITTDLQRRTSDERFRSQLRRRVALVIGVDGAGIPPRYPSFDADAFADQLLDAENNRVPEGALRKLIGQRASRRAVDLAAGELAVLARRNDDLFVYFSGSGTVDDQNRPALVLAQAPGQKPDTVSLEELLARLTINDPRSVTLVLDCSFTAPGDRRCALTPERLETLLATHKGINLLESVQQKLVAAGIACTVLCAADAIPGNPHGMKALEIEELSRGLFTAFAVDAMAGMADADGNGVVTFEEFESFVRDRITKVAELEGEYQRGYFSFGKPANSAFAGGNLPSGRRSR